MNSTSIAPGCTPGRALADDTRLIVEDATPGQALDPLAMGGHLPDSYYDPLLVKRILSNPKILVLSNTRELPQNNNGENMSPPTGVTGEDRRSEGHVPNKSRFVPMIP